MDIDAFVEDTDLVSKTEINTVRLFAYFHLRTTGQTEFNGTHVHNWFDSQHLSRPNMSRLNKRMKASPMFVTGSNNGLFKLHARQISELDKEYRDRLSLPESKLLRTQKGVYVDPDRINELSAIASSQYDLQKLIEFCEELNANYRNGCLLAIAMLNRAIIDHVPPIFGCKKFSEVVNNYGGSKSFKESMRRLNESQRKISDQHLHTQIRKSETLPTIRQVDFSHEIDVLLSEIIRIMK